MQLVGAKYFDFWEFNQAKSELDNKLLDYYW